MSIMANKKASKAIKKIIDALEENKKEVSAMYVDEKFYLDVQSIFEEALADAEQDEEECP